MVLSCANDAKTLSNVTLPKYCNTLALGDKKNNERRKIFTKRNENMDRDCCRSELYNGDSHWVNSALRKDEQ